ncbi:chymotrypsin-elastase inhibitor ixodidin [Musca vetustissima]|uniref:chymotrypsin-elastase inhibitor ixodidin n=1 Tax=Musca vetustissima TaxID=27455 RepID=UPI002AB61E9E|nr:chymotrypsin-elastase inhibitor ixodidin [Musca vetustissima]
MFKTGPLRRCVVVSIWLLVSAAVIEASDRVRCPPNEFYTPCGDSCQRLCATLNKPCLIRHIRCPDGCYCNKGYARDQSGTCIPIGECKN